MDRLAGTGVALVTPFDGHGDLDEHSLRNVINYVIEEGVDFLVALGTTAETATLSAGEKRRVVEIVVEENRGRLPLVAGIGGNNTHEVMRELKEADWLKHFQAVLSVTPFYNKPTQDGLYEHFSRLAAVSPKPLCLYNVPGRTGVNISAATVKRLLDNCSNILGIKEASGNFEQATALLKMRPENFALLSGDDSLTLPLMSLGFDGVISVVANLLPRQCARLVKSICETDVRTARELHLNLADYTKALFEEGNPAGIKAALHIAGIIRSNTLRLPLTPVSAGLYDRLEWLVGEIKTRF